MAQKVLLTEKGKKKVGMDYILTKPEYIEYKGNNIIIKSTMTGKTFILDSDDIKSIG